MQENEFVEQLLELIATNRQHLAILLRQEAVFGNHTPPHILLSIKDVRKNIQLIKQELISKGYNVEDELLENNASPTIPSVITGLNSSVQDKQVISSHNQAIGGNARVGVAISGDAYGNIDVTDYSASTDIDMDDYTLNKIEKSIFLTKSYIQLADREENADYVEDLEAIVQLLQAAKRAFQENKRDRMVSKIDQAYDITKNINNPSKSKDINSLIKSIKSIEERR